MTEKLLLNDSEIKFVRDKRISPQSSRHRPDFLISSNFGYIIVEVDENQHNKHFEDDELDRMKIIYNDIQYISPGKQTLFIRYNYRGAFIMDKKKRLDYLLLVIKSMKDLQSLGTNLGYVKLFYNGFTGSPVINPLEVII